MRKKGRIFIIVAIIALTCVMLAACAAQVSDPMQLIRDEYGDEEFRISFNSEGMDSALADVYYTANSIPKLPTPTRLGYIFEGWYFDKAYTMPYLDDYLLLYMRDVTLYAKWSKEEMNNNGVYEISFSAHIQEGSYRNKGDLADKYGYADFTQAIVAEETYIEKAGDEILLKLQYDAGYVVPMNSQPVYTVSVFSPYSVSLSSENTIDSLADPVKTLYFDIGEYIEETEMNEPILFTVTAYNWQTEGLSVAERARTYVTYTVEFNITEFAGFSQSYINTDVKLDDGYYLVESYYTTLGGEESMGNQFNPVYSYLQASDGHYKLIKPFYPYIGMMSDMEEFTQNISNFFDRGTAFSTIQLWYGVTLPDDGSSYADSDYYPEYFSGGEYGGYSIEYHADTGRFYSVYDFGETLYSALHVNAAMSGYMEYTGGMGWTDLIVTLDLDHVLRLAEIDYAPLEGDAYTYADDLQFYAGNMGDLDEYNLTYGAVEEYGLATDYINFFWSAASASASYSQRTVHSSRVTFSSQEDTAGIATKDARYRIAHFDTVAEVFGYDPTGGDMLFADVTESGTFSGISLRETKRIQTGISEGLSYGDTIDLLQVYKEKADPAFEGSIGSSDGDITYTAYELSGGEANFSAPLDMRSSFVFTRDMAVLFSRRTSAGTNTTLVILREEQEPVVTVQQGTYDENASYTVGDTVSYPQVSYSWLGDSVALYGNYYVTTEGTEVNPLYVGIYEVTDSAQGGNAYDLAYLRSGVTDFVMSAEHMTAVYVLENRYGEIRCVYFDFTAAARGDWLLKNSAQETIASGEMSYYADGARKAETVRDTFTSLIDKEEDIDEAFEESYVFIAGSDAETMTLVSCTLKARGYESTFENAEQAKTQAKALLSEYPYMYLGMEYRTAAGDNFTKAYIGGVNFGGIPKYVPLDYDAVFTGFDYEVSVPALVASDGTVLVSSGRINARRVVGNEESAAGALSTAEGIRFNRTGTYRLYFYYTLSYDANGDRIFGGYSSMTLTFSRYIEVLDGDGMVEIVYHTDEEHPFSTAFDPDGDGTYTVSHNLGTEDTVAMITKQYFSSTSDQLFGWVTDTKYTYRDTSYIYGPGERAEYIANFHSAQVHLYPIWDKGITVTASISDPDSGASVICLSTNTNTQTVYLNTENLASVYGRYDVKLSSFRISGLTSEYEHVGWTVNGEFVSVEDAGSYTYTSYEQNDVTITAEIRRIYTVGFEIDSTYSSTFFRSQQVREGECAALPWTVTVNDPQRYRLAGWHVRLDGSYVQNPDGGNLLLEDIAEYEIYGNVVFVAVFEEIS